MIFQPVLHPVLLLVLLLPVLAAAVWLLVRSRTWRGRALWSLRALLVLVCFALLLRPGLPGGERVTLATNTDIVLVVDTTASIVAEDWAAGEPRLTGVREDVQHIVETYPGARYALITFDASAELRLPLTTDTSAVRSAMQVLKPEVTANSSGSSIGVGAKLLAETLAGAAASSSDRARMVFYFGDGEQTARTEPETFAASAQYVDGGAVFGYGTTQGGPMLITSGRTDGSDDGYIQYQGTNARSVIDEANLQQIAAQLGVEYQHRDADSTPSLPEAPTTSVAYDESGTVGSVTELYPIIVLVALALIGFELARAAMLVTQLRRLRVRPAKGGAGS